MKKLLIGTFLSVALATYSHAYIVEGVFTGTVTSSYDTTNYYGDSLADNALAGTTFTGSFIIDTEEADFSWYRCMTTADCYGVSYEADAADLISISLITSNGLSFSTESEYWDSLQNPDDLREVFHIQTCNGAACSGDINEFLNFSQSTSNISLSELDLDDDGNSDSYYQSSYNLNLYSDGNVESDEFLISGSDEFPMSLFYTGADGQRTDGSVSEFLMDMDRNIIFDYGFNYSIDSLVWVSVAEPGSVALFGLGLGFLMSRKRKQQS